jgi:hypothetical protein
VCALLLPAAPAGSQGSQPLLFAADLAYVGAFRLPHPVSGSTEGFAYAAGGFTLNPSTQTLLVTTHVNEQRVAEVSVPTPINSDTLSALPIATVLQASADITEGHRGEIGPGGAVNCGGSGSECVLGGLLVWNGRLIGTTYAAYDAAKSTERSHFVSGLTLATGGDFQGYFTMTVPALATTSFVDGYMGTIPAEWQTLLGGPALTGNCCISIISRTSYGPAAFVFNPDEVGVVAPLPATPVVFYDETHPTLGTWDHPLPANPPFAIATQVSGVAFPSGTRSVLFFGMTGVGVQCYGDGIPSGTNVDGVQCVDPDTAYKGVHAYPYIYYVWAYDANELVAVKNGTTAAWAVAPYATWELVMPRLAGISAFEGIQGVGYDPATQRLYVAQRKGDDSRVWGVSLIHVWHVTVPAVGPAPPPPDLEKTLFFFTNHDGARRLDADSLLGKLLGAVGLGGHAQ